MKTKIKIETNKHGEKYFDAEIILKIQVRISDLNGNEIVPVRRGDDTRRRINPDSNEISIGDALKATKDEAYLMIDGASDNLLMNLKEENIRIL